MTRAFRGLARASAGCGHQLHLAGSWMLQGVRPLQHLTQSTRPTMAEVPIGMPRPDCYPASTMR